MPGSVLYPATPINVPDSITQPSAAFKREVSRVMISIVLFIAVYLLMFVLSIGLVVACAYGGIALIIAIPNGFIIFIGIGIISLGVMVFIFLVKFLFAVTRYDKSNSIEIKEQDQPQLFAFIRQLTNDVQTPFPKKIFLSPDVNAAVFYNSSFWSMFLPVRKNLIIGVGLVNSVNLSEFKAVLAHEFGHFSQRSMKLGSFVYNVNKIIYNMLFQNTGYVGMLGGWASVDGIFAFFARITAAIARGIQSVLRVMYGVINKSYMRLSREMEFHADAVAASVSGSANLTSALRRVELAGAGYNIALQKCDDLLRHKKISDNIYSNHRAVLKQLACEFKLRMENDVPLVDEKTVAENNHSRINFKDQWASHPGTEDRVEHLDRLAVVAETNTDSAWLLFAGPEKLQSQLTRKIYENVVQEKEVVTIDNIEFEKKLNADVQKASLPDDYNGFYDHRQVDIINVEELAANGSTHDTTFEQLFSADNASLSKKINTNTSDIGILKAIQEKRIQTKTFDFDGQKYKQKDAATIIGELEAETQKQKERVVQLDKEAIGFFLDKAKRKGNGEGDKLRQQYTRYFESRKNADEFLKDTNAMFESLQPIFSGQFVPIAQINTMIDDLKSDHEPKFKASLRELLASGAYDHDASSKKKAEEFINTRHSYFNGTSFLDRQLVMLNEVSNEAWQSINVFLFGQFKSILESQLELIRDNGEV